MYLVLLNLDYLDCKRQNQLALDRLKGVEDSPPPTPASHMVDLHL